MTTDTDLEVRHLAESDWQWVKHWFTDPILSARLGPLDDDWLHEALTAEDGVQLVIHTPVGRPVALVGCAWGPADDLHAFTDVAVDPQLRRSGYGREALRIAMTYPRHPRFAGWLTFVDPNNSDAFAFFVRCGWSYEGLDDGMHRFTNRGLTG